MRALLGLIAVLAGLLLVCAWPMILVIAAIWIGACWPRTPDHAWLLPQSTDEDYQG